MPDFKTRVSIQVGNKMRYRLQPRIWGGEMRL